MLMQTWFSPSARGPPLLVCAKSDHMSEVLIVCDFDHTLVDENSDVYVIPAAHANECEELRNDFGSFELWREYVQGCMDLLHRKGVKRADMEKMLQSIPIDEHMPKAVTELAKRGAEFHVVSDANLWIIETILSQRSLREHFVSITTNPAVFEDTGRLVIAPFHNRAKLGPHGCSMCRAPNMCKGRIMREQFLAPDRAGIVIFVGDGGNDLCACLQLRSCDYAFARKGFVLDKLIHKEKYQTQMKATIVVWQFWDEVLEKVLEITTAAQHAAVSAPSQVDSDQAATSSNCQAVSSTSAATPKL
jgi:pyridoxal phosphate phosphatase PHOSPHO2